MSTFHHATEILRRDAAQAAIAQRERQKAITTALTMALAGMIVLIGIALATVSTGLISGQYPDGEITSPEFTSRV